MTDDRRPTTDDRRPMTDDRRPTTDDRRPMDRGPNDRRLHAAGQSAPLPCEVA
jgi:hypothetical protein